MMKSIAILFGGESSEYEVSLKSAYSFIKHLPQDIKPYLIGISKSGDFYLFDGDIKAIKDDTWLDEAFKIVFSSNASDRGFYLHEKLYKVDAAIIIMHGKYGEDGSLQGLLKMAHIPLIGSDITASCLCMDKYLSHQIAASLGINVARSVLLKEKSDTYDISLNYPLFVKPLKAGSSIGITKVSKKEDLKRAIDIAFDYDDEVIVEEEVKGSEVGVSILKKDEYIIGQVDQIISSHDFFDYEEKYLISSNVNLPAKLPLEKIIEIKKTAIRLFEGLKCRHFARVDLFVREDGEIYFNEINTIPGLTDHSRFPNMLRNEMSFSEIVNFLVHFYD